MCCLRKQYAIRIENLLRTINSQRTMGCEDIELQPYQAIFDDLQYRVSDRTLKRFEFLYQAIKDKSMAELLEENFDFQVLIADLENLLEQETMEG